MTMKPIYVPKGKALEYSELACNLFNGCSYQCTYCFVPRMPGSFRTEWKENSKNPKLRKRIMNALKLQAEKMKGDKRRVLFSFTCDPFQPNLGHNTMDAIEILYRNGIKSTVLTKAGTTVRPHLKRLVKYNTHFGTTLCFTELEDSKQYEPRASVPILRARMMREAHEAGLRTWLSIEPVIIPSQALDVIERTAEYCDLVKIGRWNYDTRANKIDWKDFVTAAVELCVGLKQNYYIKNDLYKFIKDEMKQSQEF